MFRKSIYYITVIFFVIWLWIYLWNFILSARYMYVPYGIRLLFLMIYLIIFAIFFIYVRPLKLTEFPEFKVGFPAIKNLNWRNLIKEGKSNSALDIPIISKTVNVVKYSFGGMQNVTSSRTYRIDPFYVQTVTRTVGRYSHKINMDYIKFDSQEDLQKAEGNIEANYGKNDKVRYYKSKLECLVFGYDTSNPDMRTARVLNFFVKTLRLKSQEHLHLKKDKFVAIISLLLLFLLLFNLNNVITLLWASLSSYGIFSVNEFLTLILSVILTITILAYSKKLKYVENSTYDVLVVLILILSLISNLLGNFGFIINHFDFIRFKAIQNLFVWAILIAAIHFLFYRRTLKQIKD